MLNGFNTINTIVSVNVEFKKRAYLLIDIFSWVSAYIFERLYTKTTTKIGIRYAISYKTSFVI